MIFFGTSSFSIHILEQLETHGISPTHIVTVPDRPQGRKLIVTPPPIKTWALERNIPVLQFEKLKPYLDDSHEINPVEILKGFNADMFIVASYGKIIPHDILHIPSLGSFNVHPSLLPKYRGASPLQSTLLADEQNLGVCVIKMDAEMDHGPIAAVEYLTPGEGVLSTWPLIFPKYEKITAQIGANLLAQILPSIQAGNHEYTIQDHDAATFTSKITKEQGHVQELTDSDTLTPTVPRAVYLQYCALYEWPQVYFFREKNGIRIRIKITEMIWDKESNTAEITKVIPEGKNEMTWKDFCTYIQT